MFATNNHDLHKESSILETQRVDTVQVLSTMVDLCYITANCASIYGSDG